MFLSKWFEYVNFVLESLNAYRPVWTQGQKISACMFCLRHRCSHKLHKLHADHKVASAADASRNAGGVVSYQTIMIIFAQPGKMSAKLLFLFGAFYTHFTLL